MNSYPHEFLSHPQPLMFVAGLDATPDPTDEFEQLSEDLRGALIPLSKSVIWPTGKDFRILLVDKGVRIPQKSSSSTHSPLSPLNPTSPLYPDGLISPVWVKKHAELIPSVFVLFLRLDDDEALIKEITERRRKLGERIKLTVVLIASAATLDSPELDPRLSQLRRASQLSAKASLFVLTPVPAEQLPEFVQSLQDALYDSAMDYYGNLTKRVRRKRARTTDLRWEIRYDWKAGWFAELRGDDATRHYEDCWNKLARLFSSTQTLPPRTKRWAEAKVLADCVAMRICRLLLPDPRAMMPFIVHVKRFSEMSRGWGIGEETFEYWSWLARQYRIFAELVEGSSAPPRLPVPVYEDNILVSAVNPTMVLQSPAYYYYQAAMCSIQRQKRWEECTDDTAPGYTNEQKVDHAEVVVELLEKAYAVNPSVHIAYKIATNVKGDLADKFYKRISPSFAKWQPIVDEIGGESDAEICKYPFGYALTTVELRAGKWNDRFQVVLTCISDTPQSFEELHLILEDREEVIKPGEDELVDNVSLAWTPGEKKVMSGKLDGRITAVRLVNGRVHLIEAKPLRGWEAGGRIVPILSSKPEVQLTVNHHDTAFVDEPFGLAIHATSDVTIRVNGGTILGEESSSITLSVAGERIVKVKSVKQGSMTVDVTTGDKTYTAAIPVLPPFDFVMQRGETLVTCTGAMTVKELSLNGAGIEVPEKWLTGMSCVVLNQRGGQLTISWRRDGEMARTVVDIPEYTPHQVSAPSVVKLHQSFNVWLDFDTALVEVATSEAFVWKGDRRVGGRIALELVAVGLGWGLLPKITVNGEEMSSRAIYIKP